MRQSSGCAAAHVVAALAAVGHTCRQGGGGTAACPACTARGGPPQQCRATAARSRSQRRSCACLQTSASRPLQAGSGEKGPVQKAPAKGRMPPAPAGHRKQQRGLRGLRKVRQRALHGSLPLRRRPSLRCHAPRTLAKHTAGISGPRQSSSHRLRTVRLLPPDTSTMPLKRLNCGWGGWWAGGVYAVCVRFSVDEEGHRDPTRGGGGGGGAREAGGA
jgi:hypothetical protein